MRRELAAFASGVLFAIGLCLAGMTWPERILSFLDVFGTWDPRLALVMIGAVSVAAIGFRVAGRRPASLFGGAFRLSDRRTPIDRRLVVGAAIFGVGWGLSGLCPGPAVVALISGQAGAVIFVLAMIAGTLLQGLLVGDSAAALPRPQRQSPAE